LSTYLHLGQHLLNYSKLFTLTKLPSIMQKIYQLLSSSTYFNRLQHISMQLNKKYQL